MDVFRRQNLAVISHQVSSVYVLDVSAGNCQRTLSMNQG
jgi:hypothetical protein